jgi:hypothetical protein
MKAPYLISHSADKHESVIPTFVVDSCIAEFLIQRAGVSKLLSEEVNHRDNEAIDLPLPLVRQKYLFENDHWQALDANLLHKLEKRFIIFSDFKLASVFEYHTLSSVQHINIALFLARFLFAEFRTYNDLNSLNSAIRILDHMVLKKIEELSKLEQSQLIKLISIERQSLEQLYNE